MQDCLYMWMFVCTIIVFRVRSTNLDVYCPCCLMENKLSLEWLSISRALQFYSQLLIHLCFAKHSKRLVLYFSEFLCLVTFQLNQDVRVNSLTPTGQAMFHLCGFASTVHAPGSRPWPTPIFRCPPCPAMYGDGYGACAFIAPVMSR